MKRATLEAIEQARAEKRPVALVTSLATGEQAIVYGDAGEVDLTLPPDLVAKVREALRHDRSQPIELNGARWFVHCFTPPLRLAIVGAVHVAQPLARMAILAGYDVTLIDPRGAFATADRFPGLTLMDDWPDEAMEKVAPDRRTAVVTLTHDPKLDDPALAVALRADPFYIGALGSRRTHAKRLDRLAGMGFTPDQMARIHGPIGLNLGGRSPSEIAIAIMAQIVQVLHAAPEDRQEVAA
jgi:xanthine dehydrogenase accessory factor